MVRASSLLIGKELSRDYRLVRLRGRGAFGSVWEAITPDGLPVALKFLPCNDQMSTSLEIRAIQAINHLYHPNLIPVEQVWCYRRYVVATMPLAEGSLSDLLEVYRSEYGTPIAATDLFRYMSQVALALDFLNKRQHFVDGRHVAYQHCDIKPSNLLLFEETVKITDFGLASPTSSPLRFHRRGGTPDFMAPEVLQGRLSDWTDQFSLAVTYCQLRGGRLPFPPMSAMPERTHIRPAPDLTMLPDKERPIVARALALAPQDRWPSSTDLVNALKKVAR
ncbi:MAG: serine/threonine protein kinase [Gemmataceae bacterium]|nr:serine/threonine protein kinase [Gemmataceae bacterium]